MLFNTCLVVKIFVVSRVFVVSNIWDGAFAKINNGWKSKWSPSFQSLQVPAGLLKLMWSSITECLVAMDSYSWLHISQKVSITVWGCSYLLGMFESFFFTLNGMYFVYCSNFSAPCRSENCIKTKINLNFYFPSSLCCPKRFYGGF